ncbi:hypothetical protein NQ315_005282 [Exocentrus adspersus]|uniref:MICOS complex subunit MIC13 n=1 Tax=Exocentrus adspersus TaxID=1586481 RepID=A0AAV8W1E9_9CUCU|nr:hypothetical protein NQ315_005282 [Exocentrus adspersus]
MIKFAVKLGLAGAAVYFTKEEGVWKNSDESVKTYNKMKQSVRPYIQEIKTQLPVELPELPERNKISSFAKQSWNAGVLTTFKFISELPQTVRSWSDKGIQKAMQNEDVRNFVNSFSPKSGAEQK